MTPHPTRRGVSTPAFSLQRRDLLRLALAGGLSLALPTSLTAAAPTQAGHGLRHAPVAWNQQRCVVLIELDGGNDGLNTFIPVVDDLYHNARRDAGLAIAAGSALALSGVGDHRLHPSLAPLLPLWDAAQLAIVQGVGYADNNRSHFRGIDIWNTGSGLSEYLGTGWLTRALLGADRSSLLADGALLARAGSNPMEGGSLRVLAVDEPDEFISEGSELDVLPGDWLTGAAGNPGLSHVLGIHGQVRDAALAMDDLLGGANGRPYAPPSFATPFPDTNLGQQLQAVAEMLVAGVRIPAFKASYNGFDTHARQVAGSPTTGKHADLLAELAGALAAFRAALIQHGRWNDVLVLTYSEFGRRLEANGSQGTDHGGASVHFATGGRVLGGLKGSAPSLAEDDLDRGDPIATTDFRSYYGGALAFLGLDPAPVFSGGPFAPVALSAG